MKLIPRFPFLTLATLPLCLEPAAAQAVEAALFSEQPALVDSSAPLRMSGAGQVLGNPTLPGGASFTGAGRASHLGNWTNEGVLIIDPASLVASGAVTFTAANGDLLHGVFVGIFDPQSGAAEAVFTWVGGTGRFVHAEGTAGFVVQQDPTGAFTFRAEGTLDS